jgi:hypothetical protein
MEVPSPTANMTQAIVIQAVTDNGGSSVGGGSIVGAEDVPNDPG